MKKRTFCLLLSGIVDCHVWETLAVVFQLLQIFICKIYVKSPSYWNLCSDVLKDLKNLTCKCEIGIHSIEYRFLHFQESKAKDALTRKQQKNRSKQEMFQEEDKKTELLQKPKEYQVKFRFPNPAPLNPPILGISSKCSCFSFNLNFCFDLLLQWILGI